MLPILRAAPVAIDAHAGARLGVAAHQRQRDHVLHVGGGEALPADAQVHAERELRGGDREVRVRRRQYLKG
jgi:hypothetical protein